jgi:HlyD family secretion protein
MIRRPFSLWTFLLAAMALVICCAGCEKRDPNRFQGYIEGEFVYVAAPYAGELKSLAVRRGDQVKEGTELFALESAPQYAMRDEAQRRLAQLLATLEDLRKGRRPTEIESLEAQLAQAKAALVRSELEFDRMEKLVERNAVSREQFDTAKSVRDQDRARVAQLEADLRTARLGSREDQIRAAEELVEAQRAVLAKAEWDLSQMSQSATQAGLVFDTLYRPGEWVAAGRPVVMLLPPENIRARAFLPEKEIGRVQVGDRVEVRVDGVAEPFVGKVSYISPKAEYTPPVIYSRETRSKLVFMIEATFDREAGEKLHPGQPIDLYLGGGHATE